MKARFAQPSGAPAVALVLALLSGASAGATSLTSTAPAGPVPQASVLSLAAAPVSVEFPADQAAWGRRLATYADAAAVALDEILGVPAPAGRIVWRPEAAAADLTDGNVEVEGREGDASTVVTLDDPFTLLARDHGVSFATGYARWIMSYSVGRLYFARRAAEEAWWDDGVALWLTDVLARRERATTPILYGLESAWARRVRQEPGVDMRGEARGTPADAVRGKAYLTLRLLEAVYGQETLSRALGDIASGGFTGVFRTAVAEALPAGLQPDPELLLSAWLEPRAAVDVGVSRLQFDGVRLEGRLERDAAVPVPLRGYIRLATGERLPLDVEAGTEPVPLERELESPPVEVRLDPDNLLPDPNRGNNRHGFGDAERIRSFFPLDRRLEIGELHLDGDVEDVDGRRVEEFTVSLENLTEEPLGLGVLVSTQWIDRPIARSQRALFVTVPAGGRTVARDFLAYPRLGQDRARIEARYWQAGDPEAFTERILRDPADLTNSYIVLRQPPEARAETRSPLERLERELEVASIVELTEDPAGGSDEADPAPADRQDTADPPGAEPAPAPGLEVSILSPAADALPVGEMTFEARVAPSGDVVEAVELYVDDVLVARPEESPFRTRWTPGEDRDVFVLRAVAVGRGGGLATSTRVLERGTTAFGASVDLVTVYATVKGSGGDLVRDLEAGDFRLLEDGVEQEIVQFSPGEQTSVSVALLLDTSSSMIGGGIRSARAGASRLVSSLVQEEDRAMILGFNDRLYLHADFTSDRERLERSIEATYPDGGTALFDAIVGSLRKVNQRSGRRALVVLSDGLDTHSDFDFADVLEYTRQSDVVVYTIGLQLMHDATELGDATDAVRDSVENLRALAEVTGGAAYFPLRLDELEDVYARIAEELEGQYSLSYYPSNQQWDGRWRTLEVSLPDRPATVQARPGYYGVRPERR